MRFDDQNVDTSGVDDVRGRSPVGGRGLAVGGGGLLGLVVTLLVVLLNNGGGLPDGALDPSQIASGVQGGTSGVTASDLGTRCKTAGAIDQYDDCYLVKVYNETDEVWRDELTAETGAAYRPPRLTFFRDAVRTACGTATSEVGPFYCPGDQRIYLDIAFLNQLQQQFGAQGRYAQAYIVAHEFGHHLQTLLGTEPRVRAEQQRNPRASKALSVALELQADCLAGVWAGLANERGNLTVTEGDVAEAQRAAAAVGDDRIQQASNRRVDPESWTHGSAADRQRWFTTGFTTRAIGACDTFTA